MFKKVSNITLIVILAALVLVYLAIQYFGKDTRSKSFREELVEIDTAAVTSIKILADDTLNLLKQDGIWKVETASGKLVDAQESSVKRTLSTLLSIEPSRIASKDPEKWNDYQVDSAATRVQVFEGDNKTLDLMVGRFGMKAGAMQQQQQQFGMRGNQQYYTYVRLQEEDEVYAADQFMGMSLSSSASSYRNTQILQLTTDSLNAVDFNYPADSSFMMQKSEDGKWVIDGNMTDSASVASFLGDLRYLSSSEFVDDIEPEQTGEPVLSINLSINGEDNATINAYQNAKYNWLIHSSRNPEALFADTQGNLIDEIFASKNQLLTP